MPAVAAAVIGGAIASRSSSKASRAQERMNMKGIAEQRRQYDLTRQDQKPFLEAGQDAVAKIRSALIDGTMSSQDILDQSPDYQFRQQQGEQALERMQSAGGRRLGGRAVKEFLRFNQGMSKGAYGDIMNRLFSLTGKGTGAANNLASAGANMANYNSKLFNNTGNAMAQNYANQNNAAQGTLKNLTSLYQYNKGSSGGTFGGNYGMSSAGGI